MPYPEFPTIFVVARTLDTAKNYITANINGGDRMPIAVSNSNLDVLRGKRWAIIILVDRQIDMIEIEYCRGRNIIIFAKYD